MPDSQEHDLQPLWEPFDLGRVRVRNRVFVSAHSPNFGDEHALPTDRHVAYHRERARGGVGLIITEAIRPRPMSGRAWRVAGDEDVMIAPFQKVVDAVHDHDTRIIAQIADSGRHLHHDRAPSWSASPIPWAVGWEVPHEMTVPEIRRTVTQFRDTALRVERAGFDGVEVHLGHGHLLQQFLSPATNVRTDAYGGDLDGRMRLSREVLEATLEGLGGRLAVGIRISAAEYLPNGLDVEHMVEIVGRLLADYPLDFVHVSQSAYAAGYSVSTQIPDMAYGPAPFRSYPERFKREFPDTPILAISRIDDVSVAAGMLADGQADLVGMTRSHIADPHIVRKAREGRRETTRSCIACNQGCIGRTELNYRMSCVVNPEVGLEQEWATLRRRTLRGPRRVLVVGGGPAGLEAAVAAAQRGHEVELVEATDALGGQVPLAASLTNRDRFRLLTDELERALADTTATVRLGQRVTGADVAAGGWDEVVVATGSRPAPRPVAGWEHVLSVQEALQDPGQVGDAPLILDEWGEWTGLGMAEHLATRGAFVTLASPRGDVGWRINSYSRFALLARLKELPIRLRQQRTVAEADGAAVVLEDPITGERETLDGVTAIIHAGQPVAETTLLRELEELEYAGAVHLVGDAVTPRTCLEAVYEGRVAGTMVGLEYGPDARAVFAQPALRFDPLPVVQT